MNPIRKMFSIINGMIMTIGAILLLVFVIWFLSTRLGFAAENIIQPYLLITEDSDNTKTRDYGILYKRKILGDGQFVGIGMGQKVYIEDNEKNIKYNHLDLSIHKKILPKIYIDAEVSFNENKSNVGDDSITYLVSAVAETGDYRVELFTEKSLIDSHMAIAKDLSYTTYGISADYEITDEWVATGVLFRQDATDGNVRLGQVAQISYSPKEVEGLFFKVRGKWRQADFNPSEYFAPEDFKQYLIFVGYAFPFANDNWVFKAEAGPGYQYIDDVGELAFEYKLKLFGWITEDLKLTMEINQSSDTGASSYNYHWGGVWFSWHF